MKVIEYSGRPARLFCCLISLLIALALPLRAADPAKTIVADTIYRADGTTAKGTLLISWPAFSTADGKPVAAGTLSVKIGANGSVNIPLIPTQGAMPSGTAYKVVISLDEGSSSTEYWAIPTLSPTTIAAIRSTQVPATVAMQVVSRDYVDAQLAMAVRRNGDETITGTKTFASSPAVPSPSTEAAAANKGYVDVAIAAAAPSASNVLNVNKGGTGTGYFTPARCVRVAADGNSLESSTIDCGVGGDSDTLDGQHAEDFPDSMKYNPHKYGAVCNGSHDDTAAFEQMFSEIAAAGKAATVSVAPGGCVITRTLDLVHMPPVIVEGVGGAEKVVSTVGGTVSGSYFINAIPGGASPVFWTHYTGDAGQVISQFFVFRDLGIVGSPANNGDGIFLDDYGNGDIIDNVTFYKLSSGIKAGNTYTAQISNSTFLYNTKGIWIPTTGQMGGRCTNCVFRVNTHDLYLENGGMEVDGHSFFESSMQTSIYARGGYLVIRDSHFECGPQTSGYRIDAADNGAARFRQFIFEGNWLNVGCTKPAANVGIYLHSNGQGFNIISLRNNSDQTGSSGGYTAVSIGAMPASAQLFVENNSFDAPVTIDPAFIGTVTIRGNIINGDQNAPAASGANAYTGCPSGGYPALASCDFEPKIRTGGIRSSQTAFPVVSPQDAGFTVYLQPGVNTDQYSQIQFRNHSGGTQSTVQNAADGTFSLMDANALPRITFKTGAGTTLASEAGNPVLVKSGTGLYVANAAGTAYFGQILSNGQYVTRATAPTAPFDVQGNASLVASLNADMVDGKHAADFALAGSCTNQVVTALGNGVAPTCASVTGAMLAAGAYRVSLTGYCTGAAGTGQVISVEGLGATAVACNQSTAPGAAGRLMTASGTVKNLYINEGTGQKNGTSMTWTVYKNNVATALTCIVASGQTTCNDVTHSFTVAAGEYLTIKSSSTASSSETLANVSVGMELWN